ncbi:hypothetical protein J4U00_gp071 [Mycobacterium phage DyoEdafos]|uniref:Helix-turn-helix DNA binding domain protein n=1 Tax=Mycobacterium phage DyoEdafos TaxID=2599860 RepID=A0A5J6TKK9_9CAUD|nr:hypothetical protein J4U00_gp071 [Mycobacterium phage DyoEdafos]QFG10299.1 hypothetical protein SEA_DYOEDAFOS_71 [Mycobacterium phage DyoEdafos]
MNDFGKIHRKFHEHRKVKQCSNGAIGLWAKANAWCRDTRSAGYIPRDIAETFGTQGEIGELIAARLWLKDMSGSACVGFRFNDYQHWNDDVEPDTEAGNLVRKVVPEAHPAAIRKQLAAQSAKLLAEGIDSEIVERALNLWLSKSLPVSFLPNLTSEAMKEAQRAATLRNTIGECLKSGQVSPLKAYGFIFTPPNPPDGLNVEQRRQFMDLEKRKWLRELWGRVAA